MRRAVLRSIAGRVGVACYAIWTALALVTQAATPCPTHDGPAAAVVVAATMASSAPMPAMPGMAHHTSHGAHHACTCVGCGCCVAALDLCAPSRASAPAPAIVALGTTLPLAPHSTAPPRTGRRLPLANAPPSGVQLTA